jgi:hypothetical protein
MRRVILISREELEQIEAFENEGGYPVDIVYVFVEGNEPAMPPEETFMIAA